MHQAFLGGLFARSLATRVAGWVEAGKLDDEDLDRELSPDARALFTV